MGSSAMRVGLAGERDGDQGALPLSAGQLGGSAVARGGIGRPTRQQVSAAGARGGGLAPGALIARVLVPC